MSWSYKGVGDYKIKLTAHRNSVPWVSLRCHKKRVIFLLGDARFPSNHKSVYFTIMIKFTATLKTSALLFKKSYYRMKLTRSIISFTKKGTRIMIIIIIFIIYFSNSTFLKSKCGLSPHIQCILKSSSSSELNLMSVEYIVHGQNHELKQLAYVIIIWL